MSSSARSFNAAESMDSLSDDKLQSIKNLATTQRQIKLEKILGKDIGVKIDISNKAISNDFAALFKSTLPFLYFTLAMIENKSVELLLFYSDVEEFELTAGDNSDTAPSAIALFKKYFGKNCLLEINITDKSRIKCFKSLSSPDPSFSTAKTEVYEMLLLKYKEFRNRKAIGLNDSDTTYCNKIACDKAKQLLDAALVDASKIELNDWSDQRNRAIVKFINKLYFKKTLEFHQEKA